MFEAFCPVCDSNQHRVIRLQSGSDDYLSLLGINPESVVRSWRKCDLCSSVYNSPRLEQHELSELYARFRDSAWRNETPDEYFDRITQLPVSESENFAKLALLLREIPELMKIDAGSVLDIGCGGGVLLHTLLGKVPAGWKGFGVEPTETFAELADRRSGARVIASNYAGSHWGGQQFDLITCCQVLEHVPDPAEFLAAVRSDLAREGLFYLEVPDVSDFQVLPPDHDRFMMQHISYFSEQTLVPLVVRNGFSVRSKGVTQTVRHRNNLWMLLKGD